MRLENGSEKLTYDRRCSQSARQSDHRLLSQQTDGRYDNGRRVYSHGELRSGEGRCGRCARPPARTTTLRLPRWQLASEFAARSSAAPPMLENGASKIFMSFISTTIFYPKPLPRNMRPTLQTERYREVGLCWPGMSSHWSASRGRCGAAVRRSICSAVITPH